VRDPFQTEHPAFRGAPNSPVPGTGVQTDIAAGDVCLCVDVTPWPAYLFIFQAVLCAGARLAGLHNTCFSVEERETVNEVMENMGMARLRRLTVAPDGTFHGTRGSNASAHFNIPDGAVAERSMQSSNLSDQKLLTTIPGGDHGY
jgi:hypothetical protein